MVPLAKYYRHDSVIESLYVTFVGIVKNERRKKNLSDHNRFREIWFSLLWALLLITLQK